MAAPTVSIQEAIDSYADIRQVINMIADYLQANDLFNVQEFADNAAAIAGGVDPGKPYRTGDVLKVVH